MASDSAPSSGAERKERKPLMPWEKPMTSHMRSLPKCWEMALALEWGDRQASAVRKTGGTVWRRRSVATHLGQDGRDEAPCEKLEENDDGNVVDVRLRRPAAALCWKWGVEGGAAGERERGQCRVCAWG